MKQYKMVELRWIDPASEGPHVMVDLCAEVTYSDRIKRIKGFYAGNDTYNKQLRNKKIQAGVACKITNLIGILTNMLDSLPKSIATAQYAKG